MRLILSDNPLLILLPSLLFVVVGLIMKINPHIFLQTPPSIFSTLLIIGGSIRIMFYSYSIVVFDKIKNELKITRYGLVRFDSKTYFISKIKRIHYKLSCLDRAAQLELYFIDDEKVPLTIHRNSDNWNKDREIGRKISNFLGIQYIQDEIDKKR